MATTTKKGGKINTQRRRPKVKTSATKIEFIINLKAAKQIGLTVPVRVLERANQVIK